MFKKIKAMKSPHQVFFALLIGFAVISFWRAIWGLWDIYVFPENYELSLWISLILSLLILIPTHYIVKELM